MRDMEGDEMAISREAAGVFDGKNMSLYTYCHHNPLIFMDPDGLWSFKIGSAFPSVSIPLTSFTYGLIISDRGIGGYTGLSVDFDIGHLPINASFSPGEFKPGPSVTGDLGIFSPDLNQAAVNLELSILDMKDSKGEYNWGNFFKDSSYGWSGFGVGAETSFLLIDFKYDMKKFEEALKIMPGHEQGIFPQMLQEPVKNNAGVDR